MVRKNFANKLNTASLIPLAPLVILAGWLAVLHAWTLGFSAFTTYSHTLRKAGPLPRPAPVLRIRDQFGVVRDSDDFRGRHVLLQFSYLSCGDVCPRAVVDFQSVHHALAEHMPKALVLLTVSFDPGRDKVERLQQLWQHHGRPEGWFIAALSTPLDENSQADLRRLGLWVERRDNGVFNHAALSFIIDPQGRVVQVFQGDNNSEQVIAALKERLS
jgi:cytochrome oxidase Cu insertion factor (SCO1/SenC/PrrC family)